MPKKQLIQEYINNFRRRIAMFFRPGIGMTCKVYPAETGGAILEFTLGPGVENDDTYDDSSSTITDALGKIKQRAFGGNLNGFVFHGTNVILEDNRFIFIKDDSPTQWSDRAAKEDLARIMPKPQGATP
ncbi:MAG TPA: hypothetical protein VED00_01805 [archaeon]|nr:hypothetical protein [archaeon]